MSALNNVLNGNVSKFVNHDQKSQTSGVSHTGQNIKRRLYDE